MATQRGPVCVPVNRCGQSAAVASHLGSGHLEAAAPAQGGPESSHCTPEGDRQLALHEPATRPAAEPTLAMPGPCAKKPPTECIAQVISTPSISA